MSKNLPRLGGDLIARKGEAAPTTTAQPVPLNVSVATPSEELAGEGHSIEQPVPKGLTGTIAVTVRLDPNRYERLKVHGAKQRLSNQQILVAALDAYLTDNAKAAAE